MRSNQSTGGANALFIGGLALFAAAMLAVAAAPLWLRGGAPVPVDSYYYILKAAQLLECPLQDCRALEDLRAQFSGPPPDALLAGRDRAILLQRVFYMYTAGHSALVAGAKLTGLSWESALNLVATLGALVLIGGTAWFLRALAGPAAAGAALILLSFQLHPGFHGLHWIVPSNMALAGALPLWAAILSARRRETGASSALLWALPAAVLLIVWLHPVGRLYAGAALALFALLIDRRRGWSLALVLAALAWASPMILPLLTDRPTLSADAFLHPQDWDRVQAVLDNLEAAGAILADRFGGWVGIGVLALAALGTGAVVRRRDLPGVTALAMAAVLLTGSLLHGLPGYPAELFQRVFVPAAIVTTGLAGLGLTVLAEAMRDRGARRQAAGRAITGVALGALTFGFVQANGAALFQKAAQIAYGGLTRLDPPAFAEALAAVPPGAVVYRDQLSLYLGLTYGGLRRGAVYARPFEDGTEMGADALAARDDVVLSADRLTLVTGGAPLGAKARLTLTLDRPVPARAITLTLHNPSARPVRLEVEGGEPVTLPPRREITHRPFADAEPSARRNQLILAHQEGPDSARLNGLALAADQGRHWPWRPGMTVVHVGPPPADDPAWRPRSPEAWAQLETRAQEEAADPDQPLRREARVAADVLSPTGCRTGAVLYDASSVVLARIGCDDWARSAHGLSLRR